MCWKSHVRMTLVACLGKMLPPLFLTSSEVVGEEGVEQDVAPALNGDETAEQREQAVTEPR